MRTLFLFLGNLTLAVLRLHSWSRTLTQSRGTYQTLSRQFLPAGTFHPSSMSLFDGFEVFRSGNPGLVVRGYGSAFAADVPELDSGG